MTYSSLFPNGTVAINAITASNGSSIFECWALNPGFDVSSQQGTVGSAVIQLGDLANASYTILPAHYNAGLHHPLSPQLVIRSDSSRSSICLSGLHSSDTS